jgi:hypothetical protein
VPWLPWTNLQRPRELDTFCSTLLETERKRESVRWYRRRTKQRAWRISKPTDLNTTWPQSPNKGMPSSIPSDTDLAPELPTLSDRTDLEFRHSSAFKHFHVVLSSPQCIKESRADITFLISHMRKPGHFKVK